MNSITLDCRNYNGQYREYRDAFRQFGKASYQLDVGGYHYQFFNEGGDRRMAVVSPSGNFISIEKLVVN